MTTLSTIPASRDKLLFTPGPLTTSRTVKQAMLCDAGSWHDDFNQLVASIRERLLKLAGVSRAAGWEVIPMQGSGTFGVESVFQTCVPPSGKVAVLANGAYGERIGQMLACARINHLVLRTPETAPNDPDAVRRCLDADPAITHVAMVHCETTTGILNPIAAVGSIAHEKGKIFIVDAISSFGVLPIDFEAFHIDFLVASANKCIEGTPGFSFVFCRRSHLLAAQGWARSLSLDLLGQFQGFEKNGKFRYTPPTHTILAFDQALRELELEGGPAGRLARYCANHQTLARGMQRLGFLPLLPPKLQSPIITSFCYPSVPHFDFKPFYDDLADAGFIIYPGKLTQADTFRIATIGRLFPADFEQLLAAIDRVMRNRFSC